MEHPSWFSFYKDRAKYIYIRLGNPEIALQVDTDFIDNDVIYRQMTSFDLPLWISPFFPKNNETDSKQGAHDTKSNRMLMNVQSHEFSSI